MKTTLARALPVFAISLLAFGTAQAQQDLEETFLNIPGDALQSNPDYPADRTYLVPDAFERVAAYNAVMVDQPELWISEDSKYKGLKPDDQKVLADSWREAVIRELYGNYDIVEEPGPGVLLIRMAAKDLMVKKQRGILSYTPVGAVAHAMKSAMTDDILNKLSLSEFSVEMELSDSATGEVLAALIEQRRDTRQAEVREPADWEELIGVMTLFARRLNCRLNNINLPEAEAVDCRELVYETVDE